MIVVSGIQVKNEEEKKLRTISELEIIRELSDFFMPFPVIR
jgi:hypothetical protein